MLAHIKDIIRCSTKDGYAVGAFNVHNFETIIGVARAAVRMKSPVIIQVSEGAIEYMGLKPLTHIVSTVAKNLAASVPVALHIDHGRSFDSVFSCIDAGFSSVHIDGSHLALDENVKLTKRVTEATKGRNVWVQGEVGAITGGHGEVGGRIENVPLADVDEVVAFVKQTKVDTIAAAIGTAHGSFTNEKIHFGMLKEIKARAKKPFVLHGGSGLPDRDVRRAIREGVNVINIGTDVKVAFSQTLIQTCLANKKETDPRHLLKPTMEAVEAVVAAKMKLFGSAGRVK
jgi:fructose-bisphosphate aldolase, class II